MYLPTLSLDKEVFDHRAVSAERLRSHTRCDRLQVLRLDAWHHPTQASGEPAAGQRAGRFPSAWDDVAPSQGPLVRLSPLSRKSWQILPLY